MPHRRLSFLTCDIAGETYGAWYRMLPDNRIEVLTKGFRVLIAPTTVPAEKAIELLLREIVGGKVPVPNEWAMPANNEDN